MALIPDNPKHQRALVVILAAAGAIFAIYQWVYTPTMETVQDRRTTLETLEESNRNARLTMARGGGNLEEQLALYERHVAQLEALIPASEEVPALISTITREGQRLGVEIQYISPQPDQPGTFYTKESYELRTIGEYHDIGRFLTEIASLPRIITPVQLDLGEFNDPQDVYRDLRTPLLATFQIETYVLPEEGSGPPPADVGGEG